MGVRPCLPAFLRSNTLVVGTVVVLAVLPYLNSLHGEITYDDKAALFNPDVVDSSRSPWLAFSNDFWGNPMWQQSGVKTWSHKSYRPLTVLSLRLDNWLGGGTLHAFHVTNVIIHAAACGLGAALCLLFFGRRRLLAFAAAVLFALHPVHGEVVANVTSRAEPLSCCFMFAALLCYRHAAPSSRRLAGGSAAVGGRGSRGWVTRGAWLAAAVALTVVGTLCKETAIVTPALLAAYDFAQPLPARSAAAALTPALTPALTSRRSCRGSAFALWRRLLRSLSTLRFWVMVVTALALVYVRVVVIAGGYEFKFSPYNNPLTVMASRFNRALSILRFQSVAMALLLVPISLTHEHLPLATIHTLLDWKLLQVVAVWVVFVWHLWTSLVSLNGSKRQVAPLLGLVFLIVPFIPACHTFITTAFLVSERAMFMPSFGFAILAADQLGLLFQAGAVRPKRRSTRPAASSSPGELPKATRNTSLSWGTLMLLLVLVVVGSAWFTRTWSRNRDWASEATMMASNLEVKPTNAMTLYGTGYQNMAMGRLESAEYYLWRAVYASPGFGRAWSALGEAAMRREAYVDMCNHFIRGANSGVGAEYLSNCFVVSDLILKDGPTELLYNKYHAEWLALMAAGNAVLGIGSATHLAAAYNNAGCVRMTSPPRRFGSVDEARASLSVALQHHPTQYFALDNLAVLEAVELRFGSAVRMAQAGLKLAQQALSVEPASAGHQSAVQRFKQLVLALQQVALRHQQGDLQVQDLPDTMNERAKALGLACVMHLLLVTQPDG